MKPRKAVQWFAQEMEGKLRENDHKDGWQGCRFSALFPRLREETDELLVKAHPLQLDTIAEKLSGADACELIRECADIANFAMMIADNIRAKQEA
ncbi:MAG: hypothetical protein KKA68_21095 [Gammaproteobacteria bacterium]|nr:hypothetical protein [Gammaproteobacteria bacterium]